MNQKLHEAFSPEESEKIYTNFLSIINDSKRRGKLFRKYGANAENVAYGTAVNQVKKEAGNNIEKPTTEEPMDQEQKLKEMVRAALSKPLNEFKSEEELISDEPISEDLDLGHQDNEPHMIKAELAHVAKYAIELYKMVDQFEGPQEVDFPAWWQSKITTARNMISSAKHYLEFELEEPKIDAMVGITSKESALDEEMTPEKSKKIGMPFKDVAEAVLAKLKQK
jgi:hypothetical protein